MKARRQPEQGASRADRKKVEDASHPGGIADLLRLVAPQKGRLALACLLAILSTLLAILPLLFFARMIAASLQGDAGQVATMALAAALALLLQGPALGAATGVAHLAAFDLLFTIRQQLMRKLASLPLGYFTSRQSTSIKRVLNEEVEAIELFASHQLPDVVSTLATVAALSGVLFWVDWRMALAIMAVIPLAGLAQALMMRGHAPNIAGYLGRVASVNASAVELVRGLETIRMFQGARLLLNAMQRQVADLYDFSETWRREWMPPWVFYTVIIGCAPLISLPLGLWLHAQREIELPALIFCLMAATGYGRPLLKLALYSEILLRVQGAQRKVSALLDTSGMTMPVEKALREDVTAGDIVYEQVGLGQPGRQILQNINLTLPMGGIAAIVGPSGAGKTALVRLLSRDFEASHGRITIGGRDIRDFHPDALARTIGVVTQNVFLFNDTIRENIRLACEGASDEDVEAAARAAHCDVFIAGLSHGYETRVGEGGARLSGGQRQRVALARALLADASILVLDEATSFVDALHEALLQDAVGRLVGSKTVIVVSHRLDCVAHCDRIVLVEAGRALPAARHEALLTASPRYRDLWQLQQRNLAWELAQEPDPFAADSIEACVPKRVSAVEPTP